MDGSEIDANDEASLQEALQQIDEWDTDFAALFGFEDLAPSPKRQRRPRRPSAKQERLDLQQQLGDLQSEAAALRASRVPSRDADALWNEIAARQREQRVSAEVENSKLRRVLDGEREAARRFALLAGKVATIGTALGSSAEARVDQYKGPQLDPQAHLKRLDGHCREAQTVFTSGRFAENAGRDFRDVDFQNRGRDGLLIELAVSWVLPFEVERVVEALWFQTTRMPRMERTTSFKDIYAAERTLVSHFVSEANTLGTIHADHLQPVGWSAHGQIATRYEATKPDGLVLLVSDMDVNNFQQDGTCRSFMQGNGFLLVEPLTTPGAGALPACRVNWCRRVQGRAPDGSTAGMAEYAKFAHSMTSRAMREKWWSSIELHLQAIENSLFDAVHGDQRLKNASCAAMCLGTTPRLLPS